MHKHFVPLPAETADKKELLQLNPLVLAFVGDSVQTLYVRTRLALLLPHKTGALHSLVSREINAVSQSEAIKKIMDSLTTEEQAIFKRARNAKSPNTAKNATPTEYHLASGFEAVIGYLYLSGRSQRLEELIEKAYPDIKQP